MISTNDFLDKKFHRLEHAFLRDLTSYNINKLYINNIKKQDHDNSMNGGNIKTEEMQYKGKDGKYTFKVVTINNPTDIHISVVPYDDPNSECLTILIDKKEKIAILHNMSSFNKCAKEGLQKPGAGHNLMKFAIILIIKYKKTHDTATISDHRSDIVALESLFVHMWTKSDCTTQIHLKDNSFIPCFKCSTTVKIARLRMVTRGRTWYSTIVKRIYL